MEIYFMIIYLFQTYGFYSILPNFMTHIINMICLRKSVVLHNELADLQKDIIHEHLFPDGWYRGG